MRDELNELEFDFQSGKLSETDYAALKQEIESKGGAVLRQLKSLPAEPARKSQHKPAKDKSPQRSRFAQPLQALATDQRRRVSYALRLSPRRHVDPIDPTAPRRNDSMTGDFMTGTTPANGEAAAALAEGKQAFSRQEFPKAIEAFKKVLSADPNHPEAHSYMGFVLMQAGHGDGALMAFEKALTRAPNFPMALWGKGMVLYQDKKDFAGAREIFERLLNLVPPGEERNEVAKVLAEIPATGGAPKSTSTAAPAATLRPAKTSPAQSLSIQS